MEIQYDKAGRMLYNPEFHPNKGKAWSMEDLQYLKDWYQRIGPEEMSFALGRPMGSIMQKASLLKKRGEMKEPVIKNNFKRIQA
ncbi:hypothetical protein [uncultured Clostridium sp.]|uniref:hypothetical protein n=1 Tax=uncultured Clostridium sp. TaxID=59620 RepID=UPI0028E575C2|nr:hypothetical protein [uncultured Clostridium sp.]